MHKWDAQDETCSCTGLHVLIRPCRDIQNMSNNVENKTYKWLVRLLIHFRVDYICIYDRFK